MLLLLILELLIILPDRHSGNDDDIDDTDPPADAEHPSGARFPVSGFYFTSPSLANIYIKSF